MGVLSFYLNHVLLAYLAIQVAKRCFSGRENWRQILAGVAAIPLLIQFVILSLSMLHQLHTSAITLMLAGFSAGLFCHNLYLRRKLSSSTSWKDILRSRSGLACILILIVFLSGFAMGHRIIEGTSFHPDDLSYHGPFAAHWMLNEGLCWAPYNYHAYYPFNSELISLWSMVPLHNDAFAGLAGIYWLALLAVAVAAAGRLQLHSGPACGLAVIMCCSSTVVLLSCRSFSAVDLAASASFMAGLAFMMPGASEKPTRQADLIFAGLLCGYAVGCKVSYAPILIATVFCVVYCLRKTSIHQILTGITLFTLASVIAGGFWYIRNFLATGNPVFPAAAGPFDGPLTDKMLSSTKLITHLRAPSTDISVLLTIMERHVHWPTGLFLASLGGYIASFVLLIKKFTPISVHKPTIAMLFLIGLLCACLYPWMPFTAGGFSSEALLISTRYLILPFVIGIVLLIPCWAGNSRRAFVIQAIAIILLVFPWNMSLIRSGVLLTAVILLFLCIRVAPLLSNHLSPLLSRHQFILILATAFFLGWVLCYPIQKLRTEENLFDHYGDTQRPIGKAWKAVSQLPPGSRVLALGPASYEYYPLFGRDFCLYPLARPSACTRDHFIPYHLLFKQDPSITLQEAHQQRLSPGEMATWAGEHTDYILVSKWDKTDWPAVQSILKSSDFVTPIYDDGYSTLWQVTAQK